MTWQWVVLILGLVLVLVVLMIAMSDGVQYWLGGKYGYGGYERHAGSSEFGGADTQIQKAVSSHETSRRV